MYTQSTRPFFVAGYARLRLRIHCQLNTAELIIANYLVFYEKEVIIAKDVNISLRSNPKNDYV